MTEADPIYHRAPRALLICDRAAAPDAAEAAARGGVTIAAAMPVETALGRLADFAFYEWMLVECAGADEPVLDSLFCEIASLAEAEPVKIITTVTFGQLDLAAEHLIGSRARLLCAPSLIERCVAFEELAGLATSGVHDSSRDPEHHRLRLTGERIKRVSGEPAPPLGSQAARADAITAVEVSETIRARRRRDEFFKAHLFADPAWDILLDLYLSYLEGRTDVVSSVCVAAAVPATTALRWIGALEGEGLVVRLPDESDRRRVMVRLTTDALARIEAYFAAIRR